MKDVVKEEINVVKEEYEKLNGLKFAIATAIPLFTYINALRGNPIYTGIKFFISPQTYEIPMINIAYADIKNGKEPFHGATNSWIKFGAYMTTGVATVPMYIAYKITPEKKMKKITKFIDKKLDGISRLHKKVRNKVLSGLNKIASKILSFIIRKDIDIAESVSNFFREKYFDKEIQENIKEVLKEREIKLGNVEEIFDNKSKIKADENNKDKDCYVKNIEQENGKVKLGNPINTTMQNRDKVVLEF